MTLSKFLYYVYSFIYNISDFLSNTELGFVILLFLFFLFLICCFCMYIIGCKLDKK